MNPRLPSPRLLAATLLLAVLGAARAEETGNSIKFSDPAKPGTVKIILARGDLRIQGSDSAEVSVKSEEKAETKAPRKDGLRVLTSASTYSLSEKGNVITLDAVSNGWVGGNSDFRLTVPHGASLVVQNSWGGDITCSGVSGDIEIHSMNGEIRLNDVAGGVVVDTMNGEIRADIREMHDNKPLSFQSMNGEVVLRVPPSAKANIRLRTQNGAVLTDFDETSLVTKTENTPRTSTLRRGRTGNPSGRGVIPPEAQQAIREATRASAQAMREASQAVRDGLDAARDSMESSREKAEAAREASLERSAPIAPIPPTAPMPPTAALAPLPPKPPTMPTVSGGKLVTGTLNGGGPEISVATMNGDVTLRQLGKP